MPQQPTTEDPLQWIAIDDFTPGCYSNGGVVVGNTVDRMLSAPPGAADAENTWSCYALPSKALAALPGVTEVYTWPDLTTPSGYNTNGSTYIVGLLVHDELANGDTEAILISEFDDGFNHYWHAYSYILETVTPTLIVTTTKTSALGIFGSPYPQFTRAALAYVISATTVGATTTFTTNSTATANPFTVGVTFYLDQIPAGVTGLAKNTAYTVTAVGGSSGAWTFTITTPTTGGSQTSPGGATILEIPYQPVVVFPSGGPAQSVAGGQLYMYPNPATPTSYIPFAMMANPGDSITGQTIVHQSRIFVLAGVDYGYPAGGGFATNENLNFTDPPLSASMGDQQTVLVAEEPFGYGCAGSISAGELFLVKKRGGGVVLTGDIVTSAQVTMLPGVQPTGNIYGNAASTPMGFVYCSFDNGAWVWNGSNTSQKISQNLDDGFFLPPEFSPMASNNYGFYVSSFGDKVYFSNNWIYDTRTAGWWTYYPRKSAGTVGGVQGEDLFWVQPVNGNYVYASQLSFVGATSFNFMYRFDPSSPAQYYQWRSLPFRVTDRDHRTDIREVVIRASCSAANAKITVSIYDQDVFQTSQVMPAVVGTGPEIIRFNMPGGGYSEPQIQVAVQNASSSDMPIIHSIEIGYRERAHQAVQN